LRSGNGSDRLAKLILLRAIAFQPRSRKSRGGELMKAYELLYFVAPSIDEESRATVSKRIETAIAEGNGAIDNVEEWGKRKLAFEVEGLTEGDYTLVNFHADPDSIAELDRILRITDAVKRHMIVRRTDRD
jgi:small subunit ribosomal protein S6